MSLLLFDIDGTLIDSRKLIVEAKRRAFAEHGLPPPDVDRMLSVVGLTPEAAFTILVGEAHPVAEIAHAYRRVWHAIRTEPDFADALFPGAADLIARLASSGHRLGIATGRSNAGVQHLLERENWGDIFCTVQTEDVARSKPDPDMVLRALLETGAAPHETIVIGDTTFDMQMARAANVQAIGVSWGYHKADLLLAAGAQAIATDMTDLAELIEARSSHAQT